jgi:hypothetical protein
MLHKAYSNDTLSQTMTYEQFKHFKTLRTSTDNDKWSGQPSISGSEPGHPGESTLSMEIVN